MSRQPRQPTGEQREAQSHARGGYQQQGPAPYSVNEDVPGSLAGKLTVPTGCHSVYHCPAVVPACSANTIEP
jgi:hypothetical protein